MDVASVVLMKNLLCAHGRCRVLFLWWLTFSLSSVLSVRLRCSWCVSSMAPVLGIHWAPWTQGFIVCTGFGKVFLQIFLFALGTPVVYISGHLKSHTHWCSVQMLVFFLYFVLNSLHYYSSRSLAVSSVMSKPPLIPTRVSSVTNIVVLTCRISICVFEIHLSCLNYTWLVLLPASFWTRILHNDCQRLHPLIPSPESLLSLFSLIVDRS